MLTIDPAWLEGIVNSVFTLPAVFFLDSVGRRKLLLTGAVGCFISLVMVGSLIAAFSNDWPNHAAAGRTAIGACNRSWLMRLALTTFVRSLCLRLRRLLFVFMGPYWMGVTVRDLLARYPLHWRLDYHLDDVVVQRFHRPRVTHYAGKSGSRRHVLPLRWNGCRQFRYSL